MIVNKINAAFNYYRYALNRFWKLFGSLAACFTVSSSSLLALPKVKEVARGNAHIEGNQSNHLRITASDKAIINYESFNIAENQQVTFIQPKSSSAVLNRVQGGNPSSLMGRLN